MIISFSWGLTVLASGYLSRVISIPALSQFLQHLDQHLHTPPSAHSSLAQLATGHQSYVCLHFILRDSFPDLHSRRGLSHLSFQIILLLPLVLHGNAHLIFLSLLFKKKESLANCKLHEWLGLSWLQLYYQNIIECVEHGRLGDLSYVCECGCV